MIIDPITDGAPGNEPDDIRRRRTPFSSCHRIITMQATTREVVVIGEQLHDDTGEVIGAQGFYFDVTATDGAREVSITKAIAEIADNRLSSKRRRAS